MVKKLKNELKHMLANNIKGYILIVCVFFAGMTLSYVLNITSGLESEIKLYINDFLASVKNYSADSNATFLSAMSGYLKGILLLMLMSLSVLGSVGTLAYVFIKGFSYGIVLTSMLSVMESKAILLFLCLILPHCLILAPCFLAYSLFCMKNAYSVSKGVKDIKMRIIMPVIYGIFSLAVLSAAALVQAYLEPLLTRVVI